MALHLLEREGQGAVALYRNTAERENVLGLMLSLHMLIESGDAFGYTGADFRGWCTGVGFQSVEVLALGGPASAGIAYK